MSNFQPNVADDHDLGYAILSAVGPIWLLSVFVLPLFDIIESVVPILFAVGVMVGGGHLLAVISSLAGEPRFHWRFLVGLSIVLVMFCVNRFGGFIANDGFDEYEIILLFPGILLAMQFPLVVFQMFGKWRIRRQSDDQPNLSIVDLMLFTVVVAAAFACFNTACMIQGSNPSEAIQDASVFVGVTMVLSVASWFLYIRLVFRTPPIGLVIVYTSVSTMVVVVAGWVIGAMLGAVMNVWWWEWAIFVVGFASTLVSGLIGVRLSGGELVSGNESVPVL